MREFAETPDPMIGTHAGMSCPVERHALDHQMQADFVDASAAVLLGGHHAFCPLLVCGKQIQCQPMLAGSDHIHYTVHLGILKGHDRQQRIEELMLHDRFIDGDRIKDRRIILHAVTVALSAKDDAITVLFRLSRAFIVCRGIYQARILWILTGMLTDLFDNGCLEFTDKILRDLFRDRDLVDVDADLAAVADLEKCDSKVELSFL